MPLIEKTNSDIEDETLGTPDLKSAKMMTPLELNSVPVAANGPVITDDDLKKAVAHGEKNAQ